MGFLQKLFLTVSTSWPGDWFNYRRFVDCGLLRWGARTLVRRPTPMPIGSRSWSRSKGRATTS
jgi:hypothetical protein